MPKVTTSTDNTKTPRSMRRHPKLVQAIVDADKNSINNFDGNRVEIERYREKVEKDLKRQQLEELHAQSMRERVRGRTNSKGPRPSIVGSLSADTCHPRPDTQPFDTPPQPATLEDPNPHRTSRNIILLHLPDYTRYSKRSEGGVDHPPTPSPSAQKKTPPCATPAYDRATPEAPSMPLQYYATMLPGVPSTFYPFAHTPDQSAIPPLPYPLASPSQLQAPTELVSQENTVRTGEQPTSRHHHSLHNRTTRVDKPYRRPSCLTSQGLEGDCRLPSGSSNTSVPHSGASQVVDAGVHCDEPQDRQPPIERSTTTELRRDYHTVASIRNQSESTTHAEAADHASRPLGSPSKVNAHHDDTMLASTRMPECLSQNGWGNALHHRASHQPTCRTETPGMPTFSDSDLSGVHTDDTQRALQLDSDEHAIVTSRLPTEMTSQSAACEAHSAFAPAYPSLLASTYYDYGVLAPGHTRPLSLPNATAEYARDDTFGTAQPPAAGLSTYYRDMPAHAPSQDLMLSQPEAAQRAGVQPRAFFGIADQSSSGSIECETASLVMDRTVYDTSATSPTSSQAGGALIASSVLEAGCDAALPEALDRIFGPTRTHSPSADTAPYDAGSDIPAAPLQEVGYYEDGRSWSWQSSGSMFGHDPLTILAMSNHPYYSSQGAAGSSISDSTGYNELEDV